MLAENIEFLITKGHWGIPKREKSVALLSRDFEDFLERHMRSLGFSVVREPRLPNGRTPDFLVKSEGVKRYVEATTRPDIHDQIMEAFDGFGHKPYTLFISVLQSSEKAHLNRRRETAREIIEWVDSFRLNFRTLYITLPSRLTDLLRFMRQRRGLMPMSAQDKGGRGGAA